MTRRRVVGYKRAVNAQRAFEEVLARFERVALLSSCSTLLAWDEETYMPAGGIAHRAEQLAMLAGMRHAQLADPSLGELVEAAAGVSDAGAAFHVREAARIHRRHARVPRALVEEIASVTAHAQHAWASARAARSTAAILPWLERVFALKREEADAIGYDGEAYDVALDEYEPSATATAIGALLTDLARDLAPLLDRIRGASRVVPTSFLTGSYPVDDQRRFATEAARAIGFDFERGRLDTSAHPFSAHVGPGDVRLTTRFLPEDFSEGFFCTLHEVGHGLYDQGLPPDGWAAPGGDSSSLGLHESQSRLWENLVARSHGFWRCFFPRARHAFPEALADVSLDAFHAAVNHVAPSPLRVRADMVTYDLHVLVRFEIERALFAGALSVADLEDAWNDRTEAVLGLRPASPEEGLLQDGHWAAGMFGYFPTYTLGNVIAAQLYAAAGRALGDLEAQFARGEFAPLLDWLRTHVHRAGHRPAAAIVEAATGSPPSHRPLVEQLERRLAPIYGL